MRPLLIVVSILAVASLGLLYIGRTQKNDSVTRPSPKTQNALSNTQVATATLRLVSEQTVLKTGAETTLNVFLDGVEDFRITGVHSEFTYDPTKIRIVDVTAGDYFADPIELAKVIDPTKNSLVFAVGTLSETLKHTQSSVYSIHVKALAPTQGRKKVISFDQSKSDVGLIDKTGNQMILDTQKVVLFAEADITIQP